MLIEFISNESTNRNRRPYQSPSLKLSLYIFFFDDMMWLDEWHIDVMFDFALANLRN